MKGFGKLVLEHCHLEMCIHILSYVNEVSCSEPFNLKQQTASSWRIIPRLPCTVTVNRDGRLMDLDVKCMTLLRK